VRSLSGRERFISSPAAVTPVSREIDVLPHGIHLFPREDHLAFDLQDLSFHRSVLSSQPMAAKKGGARCQPDASRQDRETLD
jgi:hypothetical protein